MHLYRLLYVVNRIVVLLLFACLHYSHAYDKCGRVTRITHDYDKVEEQTYSYYSSGRLQEAKNEHALVSFRYDNMGLPVEERYNEHKILRTYDKLGQISTLTSSLGANLTYERNEFGELLNFKAQQGRLRIILFRSTGTTVWALNLSVCSQAVSRRVLPMTTSAGS